ncbi:hypothetical protein [uncultured Tateyamaria sp.]|uniref:hypothetical protein n=1 Tax=uncultured Tateyamaria sp. TaxID=455651 RepID=UPI002628AF58|nr:hypothetical protein [uncultured Tateyamaria sp.]
MRAILVLVLMVFGSVAYAEPNLDRQLFNKVQDGDFIAVQAFVEDAQQRFEAGELSADDMRDLFIVLSGSHPKTTAFVKAWLNQDTGNHYARIARAWSLWNSAIAMSSSRNGWAYEAAHAMRGEATRHARFAYAAAPDLIPASDAATIMYYFNKDVGDPVSALNYVMDSHPNWGTLQRAFDFVGRYGMEAIEAFCHEYAARISDEGETVCLMYGQAIHGEVRNIDLGDWEGYNPDNPEMVTYRLLNLINNFGYDTVTEPQLTWMENAFLTTDPDLHDLANLDQWAGTFENRFGMFLKRRNTVNKLRHAHLDRALTFLEMDPLNLRLMDMVEAVQFELPWITVFNDDGSAITRRVATGETPAEEAARLEAQAEQARAFSIRRLYAAPFSDSFWHKYANVHIGADVPRYFEFEDAQINSIVFADDPVLRLDLYLLFKTRQLQVYHDAQKEGARPEVIRAAASVDPAMDILCPFVRAERLRTHICTQEAERFPRCAEYVPLMEESYAIVVDMAKAAPQCDAVRDVEIDALWYTPIPLEEVLPPLD